MARVLLDIIFAYVDKDLGIDENKQRGQWITHKNLRNVIPNSCNRSDQIFHGKSYSTDSSFSFEESFVCKKHKTIIRCGAGQEKIMGKTRIIVTQYRHPLVERIAARVKEMGKNRK